MKVLVVRHGKTMDNKMGYVQGRRDQPLLQSGEDQAYCAAYKIRDVIDVIYTSPLKRANSTAEIIGDIQGADVVIDDRLIEICYGCCEGLKISYIKSNAKLVNDYLSHPERLGAESLNDIICRVSSFWDDIKIRHKNDTILLVLHTGTYNAFESVVHGKTFNPLAKVPENGDVEMYYSDEEIIKEK